MDQLETKLFAGEKIIFRCRAHKSMFLLPVFLLLFAVIDTFLPFLLAGLAFLLFDVLKYHYNEFIVTTERVITQKGFFDKRFREIAIENISEVVIYQSFSEKLFHTGRVTVFGEHIANSTFKGIGRARDFRDAIHSQLPVEKIKLKDLP